MGTDEESLDDKARRTRDLLSSFYSPDPSMSSNSSISSSKHPTLDDINSTSFDPDYYMNNLVIFVLIESTEAFLLFVLFWGRNWSLYRCRKLRKRVNRITASCSSHTHTYNEVGLLSGVDSLMHVSVNYEGTQVEFGWSTPEACWNGGWNKKSWYWLANAGLREL